MRQFSSQFNILTQYKNVFDTVDIGYHPTGINALIPSKILHQLFLWLIEYTVKSFFNKFGSMSPKKIW